MTVGNGKRALIMEVAMELFSRRPYHKVQMDEIARRAQVAKGTLYYHFKSKESLYASLLQGGLDQMIARLKERFSEEDPIRNLNLFITEMVTFFHENRSFFMVLQQEEGNLFSKKLENCYKKICTVRELLVTLLRKAEEQGLLTEGFNKDLLADIIMGMIKAPVLKGQAEPEEHGQTIINILNHGIKGKGGLNG
jgi:AcrR family transcriptional regulator